MLHMAAREGNDDFFQKLIAVKADVNQMWERTAIFDLKPLFFFATCFFFLLQRSTHYENCRKMEQSELHIACRLSNVKVLRALIGAKADVNIRW